MLPKDYPKIENVEICGTMLPAMHIGGDYYDLIQISPKKFFIVIGDVSGKGLSASFYMSKLQTMIRLNCVEGKRPKDVLVEINKRMFMEIEKNWFITVSLGFVDMENNSLTFVRAGHTPLLKFINGKVESFQPSGVGVGLEKGELFASSLEELTVPFEPGSMLYFFSDGVTELMNSKYELFGSEKLEKLLSDNLDIPCEEMCTKLLTEFENFRGDFHQYDDITFVIIKHLK